MFWGSPLISMVNGDVRTERPVIIICINRLTGSGMRSVLPGNKATERERSMSCGVMPSGENRNLMFG